MKPVHYFLLVTFVMLAPNMPSNVRLTLAVLSFLIAAAFAVGVPA